MSGEYCYFDVCIGGKPLKERIVMQLFDKVTPKTCENFRRLCLGNDGKHTESDIPMTYKDSTFHRVIEGFMIQGGDFTNHNGTGGVSIYGERFPDENFDLPCDKAGLLAMANAGPNTNGSQFFITTAPATHLSGRHVVFGKVVRGMNAVRAIEHTATGAQDKPVEKCVIVDCGVCDALPPVPSLDDPKGSADVYPDYVEDLPDEVRNTNALMHSAEVIRQAGNDFFKEGKLEEAAEKYATAVRYLKAIDIFPSNEAKVNEKLIACYNNESLCNLKLNRLPAARAAASAVLRIDADNSKALFRRGMASLASGDTDSAMDDLSRAHTIEPANTEITAKLAQAKEKEKARNAKLASSLKKMFS